MLIAPAVSSGKRQEFFLDIDPEIVITFAGKGRYLRFFRFLVAKQQANFAITQLA